MANDADDIFKPKLGRIRSLGSVRTRSYLNQVLHRISAEGKSGFGMGTASRHFSGYRIGRGNDAMRHRRAGHRFGPGYRRVVIKTRIVKFKNGSVDAAGTHLRYIQREGVSKDHEPGQLYDSSHDDADGKAFLERSEGDRHQFRFIVSPEDATQLPDLKPFVRDLMDAMEKDLGTRLDWVAVDHFNTGHPHTHIVLRGKDDLGKDLIIARDYVAHGMRQRASELLTLELGPQTEHEIRQKLSVQVDQDRFTDLDRALVRESVDGIVDVRRDARHPDDAFRRAMEVSRLRVLARRGLVEEVSPGRWQLSGTLEETLRRAGERGDIVKTMHRGLRGAGLEVGATEFSIYDPGDRRAPTVIGRIVDRGLHDELNDSHYILVDATDGRVHYVALDPKEDMEDLPKGVVVEVHPASPGLKPSDRKIAEIARMNDGLYSPGAHRAHDPHASAEFIKTYVRRLEALRRTNVVRRFPDGSWAIPADFEERITALASTRSLYPRRVVVLSFLPLHRQIKADGATWLDRQLLAREKTALRGMRFGAEVAHAMSRRQEHLVELGLAERDGPAVKYQRNLLRLLRRRELAVVGEKLAGEMGMAFVDAQEGQQVEGIYRRSIRLASGKYAIIEKNEGVHARALATSVRKVPG